MSPTHGNKFSVSYCLSCWAWERSPRPMPWSHSYHSPSPGGPHLYTGSVGVHLWLGVPPCHCCGLPSHLTDGLKAGLWGDTPIEGSQGSEAWHSFQLLCLPQERLGASISPKHFPPILLSVDHKEVGRTNEATKGPHAQVESPGTVEALY